VNWPHLKTFIWLRWRLAANQIRRSGSVGVVISWIFTALMTAGGVVMLLAGFLAGFLALGTGSPRSVMVVWDGAIVGFVLFWLTGLMSELQRADAISLDRFLHLPVSPTSAFLINYLGSSFSLSVILMLPAMIGLSIGLVLSRGAYMLLLFPLVATFFLMMTAVTYQFRGWLASMMKNPRRRRAIMAAVPVLFVVTFQLPNVWNNLGPGAQERRAARADGRRARSTLEDQLSAGRITREEYDRRRRERGGNAEAAYDTARRLNMILPPGWLAYGAEAAAAGRVWPGMAGIFGMGLIGAVSLRRAYGTTLRLYTGDFDSGRRVAPAPTSSASSGSTGAVRPSSAFVERRLPWVSDRVSSVAVTGFRWWTRAPEMKMTLLTPVMMLVVFTGMFSGQSGAAPELLRPLATSGLAGIVLILGMAGPLGNQFAYDRAGFRAFVLSPAPRRDVLMGKNLSLLPFALATMAATVGLAQWFNPMRVDLLLGVLVQLVPMYVLFCLAGNLLSIVGPLALKPNSGMPIPHQGIRSFYPLGFILVVAPVLLGLTLLPLGIEALFSLMDWLAGFPAYLVVGLVQAVVALWVYRRVIDWEGALLQRRELQILDIVGAKAA
jgi:hypothetical protein